jgi:beta-lactam-binding protein with PASTA domain
MDDNNRFLSSYKKKMGDQAAEPDMQAEPDIPAEQELSPEAPHPMRYEEKSGFVAPRQNGRARVPPGGGRPNYLVPVIVGAVVVVGVVVTLLIILTRGVKVIDFKGWTLNDAQLWASDNGVKLQVETPFNDEVEAGKIFAQDPQDGASVKKNAFIKVSVSAGHDLSITLKLPDLMSMTKDEVDRWAASNFMAKVRVTTEFSETVEAGKVISYEINDNTVVDNVVNRNTPIYVFVSKGREDQAATLVTVPDFKTKSISESYAFASENGLVLEVVEQYDDYAPKGAIIAQSVKADEKVSRGGTITLTVSKGKKVTVPDFSNDSKQKAAAAAAELGITAAVVEKYSNEPTGAFISQSIPAGTVYDGAEVLELYYSLGNKVVVASFVGQTLDAIQAWAQNLNDQGASITVSPTYTNSDAPNGSIIYQDKANKTIAIKTTIYVTVSKGRIVFMPDFVAPEGSGYDVAVTRDEAIAMCQAAGIVPVFKAESHSGRLPGEIWYQSTAAGAEVAEGATVTLKYVPANVQVSVPSFAGMTKADVLAGGYLKQLDVSYELYGEYVSGSEGKVCDQSLRNGTTVAAGTKIVLYLGPDS